MELREARDRTVLFGMEVLEGVSGSMLAFGAFVTSYCVYEGISDIFQPDSEWESTPFTAVPGAIIMSAVMYGVMHATQTAREVLQEHRARKLQ